jgi:hypothetical protein
MSEQGQLILQIQIDDLLEDLAIHFDTEPLSFDEGWTLDDENNKPQADEARRIVKRWLINKEFVEPEEVAGDLS